MLISKKYEKVKKDNYTFYVNDSMFCNFVTQKSNDSDNVSLRNYRSNANPHKSKTHLKHDGSDHIANSKLSRRIVTHNLENKNINKNQNSVSSSSVSQDFIKNNSNNTVIKKLDDTNSSSTAQNSSTPRSNSGKSSSNAEPKPPANNTASSKNPTHSTENENIVDSISKILQDFEDAQIIKRNTFITKEVCNKCTDFTDMLNQLAQEVLKIKNNIKLIMNRKTSNQTYLVKFSNWIIKINLLRADILKINDFIDILKTKNCPKQDFNEKMLMMLSAACVNLVEHIEKSIKQQHLDLKLDVLG